MFLCSLKILARNSDNILSDRPQNWSPATSCSIHVESSRIFDFPKIWSTQKLLQSPQNFLEAFKLQVTFKQVVDAQARWRVHSFAALWIGSNAIEIKKRIISEILGSYLEVLGLLWACFRLLLLGGLRPHRTPHP